MNSRVTVPVRDIRLHQRLNPSSMRRTCYCPREGYKVASLHPVQRCAGGAVTVPVRGIRLHRHPYVHNLVRCQVTVPVRGSRGERVQRTKQRSRDWQRRRGAACGRSSRAGVGAAVQICERTACAMLIWETATRSSAPVFASTCRCAAKIGKAQEE